MDPSAAPPAQDTSPTLRRRLRAPPPPPVTTPHSQTTASSSRPSAGPSTPVGPSISSDSVSSASSPQAPSATAQSSFRAGTARTGATSQTRHHATRPARPAAGPVIIPLVTALFVGGVTAGLFATANSMRVVLIAAVVCLATFVSVLLRLLVHGPPPGRARGARHLHRLTGERAAYVRTSQRLSMMDRDFTDADYELLLGLDDNSTRLRRFLDGASQDFIDRLPAYVFSATPAHKYEAAAAGSDTPSNPELGGDTVRRCAICLEDFADGDKIRILPCFHRFMAACIDPWLLEQGKCPVCKAKIHQ